MLVTLGLGQVTCRPRGRPLLEEVDGQMTCILTQALSCRAVPTPQNHNQTPSATAAVHSEKRLQVKVMMNETILRKRVQFMSCEFERDKFRPES